MDARFARRCAAFVATAMILAGSPACAAALDSYRDHRRVVLVFAPDKGDGRLARQAAEIQPLLSAQDDRDLHLVEVIGASVVGASDGALALHERFGVAAHAFAALLIGKDGHVALRSAQPIEGRRLAAVIDAMPMRREEMSRR